MPIEGRTASALLLGRECLVLFVLESSRREGEIERGKIGSGEGLGKEMMNGIGNFGTEWIARK